MAVGRTDQADRMLSGHAGEATREKYIKARWTETAEPNKVAML